jgi:hypothetical protein
MIVKAIKEEAVAGDVLYKSVEVNLLNIHETMK